MWLQNYATDIRCKRTTLPRTRYLVCSKHSSSGQCNAMFIILDTIGTTYTFYETEKRKKTKENERRQLGRELQTKNWVYCCCSALHEECRRLCKERFHVKNIAHTYSCSHSTGSASAHLHNPNPYSCYCLMIILIVGNPILPYYYYYYYYYYYCYYYFVLRRIGTHKAWPL